MSNEVKKTDAMDDLLARRAQGASEMPWLETRVMRQVEWREQARQWLRDHPGGLPRAARQPLRLRVWSALCALASARTWPMIGAALAVVCVVYLMTRMALFAPALQSTAKYGGVSMLGLALMAIAVALVNWPKLRQFYN